MCRGFFFVSYKFSIVVNTGVTNPSRYISAAAGKKGYYRYYIPRYIVVSSAAETCGRTTTNYHHDQMLLRGRGDWRIGGGG